jgi:hypothetical protein
MWGQKSEVAIVCKTVEIHEQVRITRNLLRPFDVVFSTRVTRIRSCDGKVLFIDVLHTASWTGVIPDWR